MSGQRLGTALAQTGEHELLLPVVVHVEEPQDVVVVVRDERSACRVIRLDAAHAWRARAERAAQRLVHRDHVAGVGALAATEPGRN